MPSTAIRRYSYDRQSRQLTLWFKPRGRQYVYFDVPEAIYERLRTASSRGRFFNAAIRDRFAFQPVGPNSSTMPEL